LVSGDGEKSLVGEQAMGSGNGCDEDAVFGSPTSTASSAIPSSPIYFAPPRQKSISFVPNQKSSVSFMPEPVVEPPCVQIRVKRNASSSRFAPSSTFLSARSSPEPFSNASSKFASAVAAALGEAASSSSSASRSTKLPSSSASTVHHGSLTLRSLNPHEMRAMSGLLSNIVHNHRSASKSSSRTPSRSAAGPSSAVSNVSGLASVRTIKAPCRMLLDYGSPEMSPSSSTSSVGLPPRKLPPLQDRPAMDRPVLDQPQQDQPMIDCPPVDSSVQQGAAPEPAVVVTKTATKRCASCGKKTRLATSFQCRCGGNYCSIHRYAETHDCTFDYKTDGRRLLEQNNPLVTAPKLPKI